MPIDWKPEIRRQLETLKLEPTRENEIIEELSQHLNDRYAEMLTSGIRPEEAYDAALSELRQSELLAHRLLSPRPPRDQSGSDGCPGQRVMKSAITVASCH